MMYQPKNFLVTGGAGFIGANFIRYLFNRYSNISIINIDKLTYAAEINNLAFAKDNPNYHFIHGDICDKTLMENILRQHHIDTIVHFAAESHVDRSIENPDAFIQTNIFGTYALLSAAKKVWLQEDNRSVHECRFHHISTDEVYGSLRMTDSPFTEQMPYDPNSPYSASKASSDYLVNAYHRTYGLPISISNCSNNYGPFQHAEKLIPKVILHAMKQLPIPIYNDGSNIRDWLYVEDHCEAIDVIIRGDSLGKKYNIGGGVEYSNLTLTKFLCEKLSIFTKISAEKYLRLITFVKDRLGHDFRYAIDASKINKELLWHPKTTFEQGIDKTIQWYFEKMI